MPENRKKLLRIIIAAAVIVLGVFFVTGIIRKYKPAKLSAFGIDVYDVLLDGAGGSEENQKNTDVLRECPGVLNELLNSGEVSDKSFDILEKYMQEYYAYGYLRRAPYNSVPGGEYVTSMDAPLLGVCCQVAYERTGDRKYSEFVKDLIPYLISGTEEGGYMLKESDGSWWPLEYAWKDVTTESAWYTYNGSLFGTVCLELLKQGTHDERLADALEKIGNSYKKHSGEFYYENNEWCFYSLNSEKGKPAINTTDKLLIEMRALKALYVLTEDTFWNDELSKRTAILEKLYPVYLVIQEDGNYCCFLRSGAPHPYYVDIYPTTIELYDDEGNLTDKLFAPDRTVKHAFLKEKVSGKATHYKLYATINRIKKTLLSEGILKQYTAKDSCEINTDSNSVWGDAVDYREGSLLIEPSKDALEKAIISVDLDEPKDNTAESYWVVDLENQDKNIYPVQIVLTDEDGNSVSRYLQYINAGHNSLIFNYLGFSDATSIRNVKSVRIEFITNKMTTDRSIIKINHIYYCSSPAEVVDYLEPLVSGYSNYYYK